MEEHRLVRLPPDILDEITVAALSLPLIEASMRWPVSTRISCSDATPGSVASVSCGVSSQLAEAFFDSTVMKGKHIPMHTGLLQKLEARESDFPEDAAITEVVRCLPWKVDASHSFDTPLHVNIRELEGISEVARLAGRFTSFPAKLINGSDSEVSIGAWAKGRSPSYKLNARLRKAACLQAVSQKSLANF